MKYVDPITKATYHVYDEDSLIYRPEGSAFYQILATKSSYRRIYDLLLAYCADHTKIRDATLEDFEFFRIRPEGHIIPLPDKKE